MTEVVSFKRIIIVAIGTFLANILLSPTLLKQLIQAGKSRITPVHYQSTAMESDSIMTKRMPVYFFSHGGPNIMYDTSHPAYTQLSLRGQEITSKVKPRAIVVFSAHWQAEKPHTIEVNVGENEPLIYDFFGFPKHYYMEKFPHKTSPVLARQVIATLQEAGIKAEGVERGLDHGVWVCFKVAFDPESNPLGDVPVVQVSLFDDDADAESHIKLGKAVEKLRDEGVLIVVSGMAVHNLRHLMRTRGDPTPMSYTATFDEALREAVETTPGQEREEKMVGLLRRPDARLAHPTFEHLVPIHVGAGAAGKDAGKRVWTLPEGSVSWAQYRFGEVEA